MADRLSSNKILMSNFDGAYDRYCVEQQGKIVHVRYMRISPVASGTTVMTGLPAVKKLLYASGIGVENNTFTIGIAVGVEANGAIKLLSKSGAGATSTIQIAGLFDVVYETT